MLPTPWSQGARFRRTVHVTPTAGSRVPIYGPLVLQPQASTTSGWLCMFRLLSLVRAAANSMVVQRTGQSVYDDVGAASCIFRALALHQTSGEGCTPGSGSQNQCTAVISKAENMYKRWRFARDATNRFMSPVGRTTAPGHKAPPQSVYCVPRAVRCHYVQYHRSLADERTAWGEYCEGPRAESHSLQPRKKQAERHPRQPKKTPRSLRSRQQNKLSASLDVPRQQADILRRPRLLFLGPTPSYS